MLIATLPLLFPRVDQPDVDLDNDDASEEEVNDEGAMETDEAPEPNETTKKPMKLTYEKYKKMSFLLIDYIKNKEETAEATGSGDTDSTPKRSDVVSWYLEELEEITSQDELVEHRQIVEKVVDRLIYQDQVIVPLTNTSKGGEESDPFLVVHPNYVQDQ